MREGQPSLKSFCDLGLKLESCWVTHRQDDVDRFLGHLATNQTNRYTYQSCNCFLVFMIFFTSFHIKNIHVYTHSCKRQSSRPNCMRTGTDEIMNANYDLDDQETLTD